jgi:hypothetical protein
VSPMSSQRSSTVAESATHPIPPTGPGSALLARQADAERMRGAIGTRSTADLPHGCGRCGVRWSGMLTSHCAGCHLTFSGAGPFDRHRRNGTCLPPETVGLSLIPGRAYPCWGTVDTDATEVAR